MALAVYYDDGSKAGPSLESRIANAEGDIQIKTKNLADLEEKLALFKSYQKKALEVTSSERQLQLSEEDKASLEQKKADALQEVENQHLAFQEYRQQYRLSERTAAEGEVIDLSETLGPDYKEVTILGISATSFRVRSSTGSRGLEPAKLPLAIQDRFQFSEDEAEEHKKLLAERDKARNAVMIAHQKELNKKRDARKDAAKDARIKELYIQIDKLNIIASKKRTLSNEYKAKARVHMRDDKSSRDGGKMGMHKALAREDDNKARRYAAEAVAADKKADEYTEELRKLQRQ